MKKLLLAIVLAFLPTLALAQSQRNPCYINANGGCTPVGTTGAPNSAAPLPVTTPGITASAPLPTSWTPLPTGGTAVTASSGNVAAASAIATLPAVASRTNYICGFLITSTGSTAAAVVSPTITGVISGTMTLTYATVAGVTLSNEPLTVEFGSCIPASAVNTAITLTVPSLGAGNTNVTVSIWGFLI